MIHYQDDTITLHHGDCVAVLRTLAANSINAIVTDPPYGLEFMGKEWDKFDRKGPASFENLGDPLGGYGPNGTRGRSPLADKPRFSTMGPAAINRFQLWCQEWAAECLRVLKPGGHMLAFGGTRTWHRLACAVEDAGFEIRDSIAWLYGSGFPKSLDVSKAIDKAAGAEREVIGPSPTHTTKSMNGGAYNGNADRDTIRGLSLTAPATDAAREWQGWGTALKPAFEPVVMARKPLARGATVAANVLAHGTGAINVDGCRIEATGRPALVGDYKQTDNTVYEGRMDGSLQGGSKAVGTTDQGRWPANVALDTDMAAVLDAQSGERKGGAFPGRQGAQPGGANGTMGGGWSGEIGPARAMGDTGGASRYFFVTQPDRFKFTAKAPSIERPNVDGEAHATVKPLDLMRWLIRLVTPPGGVVLDPFAGSGTTLEAAGLEGFRAAGIEREADYLPLIVQRIQRTPLALFDDGEAS